MLPWKLRRTQCLIVFFSTTIFHSMVLLCALYLQDIRFMTALIQLFGSFHTKILSHCYTINFIRDCGLSLPLHLVRTQCIQQQQPKSGSISLRIEGQAVILCKSCKTLIKTPREHFQ